MPNDLDKLETSTTLTNWMTVTMPVRTTTSLSPGVETVTLTVPDGGLPKLFARLRVTP